MEGAFKDFDAIKIDGDPACSFNLGGREWHTRSRDDVPWPMVKRFMQAQASGDTNKMMSHIDDFFMAVLQPDEVDDFLVLEDDGDVMTYRVFSDLIAFVAEQVFGNPTKSPGTSRAGRRSTKPSSRANSSLPEAEPQTA